MLATAAHADPEKDARAAAARWSAAYTSNDVDAIAAAYWPDAVLLGTTSPVISEGTAAIRRYFSHLPGSGNRNAITETRIFVLGADAVVLAGFYTFTRMATGAPVPAPARFTFLVTRRDGAWRIAHHHSSPHVQPPG
ncbi:MAG TPA: SgcJ/EcaC family oxidoreductase [Roseomonas sp.]|jgi:uncharacterized protein (TIGR02246 family)